MDWSKVKRTDLREVSDFDRNGHFTLIKERYDHSIQVWERSGIPDCQTAKTIEIIKPIRRSDGALTYPSSEQFGLNGFSIPFTTEGLEWADYILDVGFPSSAEYMQMWRDWKKRRSEPGLQKAK